MAILIAAFVILLLLTFGVVAFVLQPSREQKAVERRLSAVTLATDELNANSPEAGQLLKAEKSGHFDWIDSLVAASTLSHKLKKLILQANSPLTVGTIVMMCVAGLVSGMFLGYAFTTMLPVALAAGGTGAYLPIAYLKFKRSRRLSAFDGTLADCIDMMGRSLRAGHSMAAAMSIVADQAVEPARTEFGEVFKQQNYGLPLREALMQMQDRMPSQDLRVLITGMLVQRDTGGNLAEMLDRVVYVIRDRIRIKGEIKTHTAQGRLTGWILCLLPVIMLVLINIINPGYSDVLTGTPFGRELLYIGMALLAVGAFIIRKIINGIEV